MIYVDQIMEVFCGEENVSCVEEWAKKRKAPQELLSRIYESLTEPRNAYQHVETIFDLFEKEEDEPIQNKIRMALIRVQLFSQYHMFERSEFRDAGDMASSLERMLFGYNLLEGKKPKKEEESSEK
ncbi:MAG: hypothetical protein AYK19_16235 [Theionarchaea archaeon DG-70-1]|nr:MAG: hypothetical protein AYK19_16235 [Theionarchaea archaeon DG-70-1]